MADIVLPVPGENPNWGSKLNTAILRINQELEALGVRVFVAETRLSTVTVRVTDLEGRVTDLEDNLEDEVRAIAADVIASDPTIIQAAEQAAEQAVEGALDDANVVTTEDRSWDTLELHGTDGRVWGVIQDLSVDPHLKGASTPRMDRTQNDALDVAAANGYVVERITGTGESTGWDETHLILGLGQSNMRGSGTPIPSGSNFPTPNLFEVPQSGGGSGQSIVAATEPLRHPLGAYPGTRGPLWTFARRYALENPRIRVVIVPLGWSGTGMYGSDPLSWAPSREGESGITSLYASAISRANTARTLTGATRVAAILWHQGERDSSLGSTGTGTPGSTYRAELEALILGLRDRVNGASQAPFIIGQLGYEYREVLKPGRVAEIDAAHKAIPGRVSKTSFAPSPPAGYMAADQTHFTGEGAQVLGDSFWDAYRPALYNTTGA